MISEEVIICFFIFYIIGVGWCSYRFSTYKKINCFGKNKENNIQSDEYTLV